MITAAILVVPRSTTMHADHSSGEDPLDLPQKPRVLIVDDHEDLAVSVAEMLNLYGFKARWVLEADVAVLIASRWPPDAALLDLDIPVVNGFDIATALRAMKLRPEPVLIAHSGHPWESRALDAGFDYFLLKPCAVDRLVTTLRVALHRPH